MPAENYTPPKIELTKASDMKIGIVATYWNEDIVSLMMENAITTLQDHGISRSQLHIYRVPGSYELVYGAMHLMEKKYIDAVLAFGCVIKGATQHDEYINHAVAKGLLDVTLQYKKPCIFGLLTTLNKQQALERADGTYGNKGKEAAEAALMILNSK